MNHKKFRRLYSIARNGCRCAGGAGASGPSARTAGDPAGTKSALEPGFRVRCFREGRRFRILAVVDDFTRECLALIADTALPGLRFVRELDLIIAQRGRPAMCVSDNGTELTGMAGCAGARGSGSRGTTLLPESRPRMPSSRASTIACGTNCSTRRCSPRSPRPARCSMPGRTIIMLARTVRWAISRQTNLLLAGAPGPQRGRSARYVEGSAPRPVAPPSPVGSNVTGTLLIAG
jgi:putative transposase